MHWQIRLFFVGMVFCATGVLTAEDDWQPPAKGEPFPGFGRRMPYEEVLDYCDVALVGRVLTNVAHRARSTPDGQDTPGRIVLQIEQVVRGAYPQPVAEISYGAFDFPEWSRTNRLHAFLCLRGYGGALRLAGDPPNGGGCVSEGPALLAALVEAAADPVQGYASTNPAVKLSAALRLARRWLATPAQGRPAPPEGMVEVFISNLRSYERGMGLNVDATAWQGINELFDCRIHAIWNYPPEMKKGRRSSLHQEVQAAWERTQAAVRQRRTVRATPPGGGDPTVRAEVAALISRLGHESYPQRQAAQEALLKIGQPALYQVQAGVTNQNEHVAAACRLLYELISMTRDWRPETQSYVFELDRAEPFVP